MEATTALLILRSSVLWHCVVMRWLSTFYGWNVWRYMFIRGIHLQIQTVSQPRILQSEESVYLSIYISIYGSTVLLLNLGRFFSFLIPYTVGRTSWTGDQPVERPLPTHRTTQTQNKRTDIHALSGPLSSAIWTISDVNTLRSISW
jgi:hypothetical protein